MAKKTTTTKRTTRPRAKAKGLGDTIEQITEATGIKAVVKSIFGDDCGCEERKEKLNKLFPYRANRMECMTEDEFVWLDKFFKRKNKMAVEFTEQLELIRMYNRIFHARQQVTNCSPCLKTVVDELTKIYDEHNKENQ